MAETSQFGLPLLSGGQAQKSVTVNEALAVIDAVAQLRIKSTLLSSPPSGAQEGEAYSVPLGATGEWTGEEGKLAVAVNGGWRFVAPKAGWEAHNEETGTSVLYDGVAWRERAFAATLSGTTTDFEVIETDLDLAAGPVAQTDPLIASNMQVLGVSGRVITPITGTLSSWSLGVAGADNRYGSGLGLALNSYVVGLTGAPVTYYADTPLLLTAVGGDFASGTVRLAVHVMTIQPPRAV